MRLVKIRGRRPIADPGLFCRLPFTEVSIDEGGTVWPNCCPDWLDIPLGNLHTQSWTEIWNGPGAQELRRSMFDGDLRHCDEGWCPHIQNVRANIDDHLVAPVTDRDRLDLPAEAAQGRLVMATGPSNVGMHYDSSCNLACPTCRADIEVLRGAAHDRMAVLHRVVVDEILPSARIASLTGTGDPFASSFLREFLVEFDRTRFPKLESLHLHTNAIMWTPAMWARMPGLHDIRVTTDISIDAACADTYEVVRTPARWDRLMANLDFIATIPNLATLGISMTVSALNHRELLAFHDLGRDLAARCPDKDVFVEYKRPQRRDHHTDEWWRSLDVEQLPAADRSALRDQVVELHARQRAGAVPRILSNLGELAELPVATR